MTGADGDDDADERREPPATDAPDDAAGDDERETDAEDDPGSESDATGGDGVETEFDPTAFSYDGDSDGEEDDATGGPAGDGDDAEPAASEGRSTESGDADDADDDGDRESEDIIEWNEEWHPDGPPGQDGDDEADDEADDDADDEEAVTEGHFEGDAWEPDPEDLQPGKAEDPATAGDAMSFADDTASDGGTGTVAKTAAESTFAGDDESGGILSGGPEYDEEMPLADHIEEMVRRLGVVVVVMAVVSIGVLPFSDQIINYVWYSILAAAQDEVSRPNVYKPLSLLLARVKTATLAGFVIALPLFVYETYLFMRPGLYPNERRYYLAAVPTSLVLAAVGVAFAFYLVLPAIFIYFLYYSQEAAQIAFGLSDTYGLMLMLMGFFAVIFQIPLFIMLAIMMNLTSREWLAERRILFWGTFLGIALLFSPDPTGMAPIIVALTMVVLFEGTLLLLRWTNRGGRGGGGEVEPEPEP